MTSDTGLRRTRSRRSATRSRLFWLDDEGETFTMEATPVTVEEATAVVRVRVGYGEPVRQEYLDLWVLHFADDGRVQEFEEWAYWPGKAYSASID